MSITGALQIGRSALTASQAALTVAGNNMANAATPGFTRRTAALSPVRGQIIGNGQYVGNGVNLLTVRREIDVALQTRLRNAIGEEQRAAIDQQFLTAIETIQNELSDNDLSSLLSAFFNAFSEVANNPEDNAVRSLAIQQGVSLAGRINDIVGQYQGVRLESDRALGIAVESANELLDQIAFINQQVALAENTGGEASSLRDQRDQLIDELAGFVDLTVINQDNGSVNILINSLPVLLGDENRGLDLEKKSVNGQLDVRLRIKADGAYINTDSGVIGGLLTQRAETIDPAIDTINEFAQELIFQVNRLHSQGQAPAGFTSTAGGSTVLDTTTNLNAIATGLPFRVENGSLTIQVTHQQTGLSETYQINVDGDAMSLDDLVNEINVVVGVANVTATVGADNNLALGANAGYEFSFIEDTSGALAALGVNTFFSGVDATTIAVNDLVADDPAMLAIAAGGVRGSNGTALSIANLQDTSVSGLGGRSLREYWQGSVSQLAARTSAANQKAASTQLVKANISAQMQGVSGVSIDEESVNMILFQRQYQAAARFITVMDETLQTLLSIV